MTDRLTPATDVAAFSSEIAEQLPRLRRYARALTGQQETGDAYAAAALEVLAETEGALEQARDTREALFLAFHRIWATTGQPGAPKSSADAPPSERIAQERLAALTPNTREALLLNTVERFSVDQIARVMGIDVEEAALRIDTARQEMADSVRGRVLIIEDEAIIAMDLEALVADAGHEVTGIARTREGAVSLGMRSKPDLILADIQLADRSSGIDAVNDIMGHFGDIPVVFITAFPERLLTGERPEPAFLITKPFEEREVQTAISHALFFASTAGLADAPDQGDKQPA